MLGISALTLLVAGCGTRAPVTPAGALIPLKVVHSAFINDAPFFIAQEEGYFQAEGLEIHDETVPTASTALPALIQGQVDVIGAQVSVSVLKALAENSPIRIVADRSSFDANGCTYTALVARKALVDAGELKSPAQLKGKRLELNRAILEGYYADTLLASAGLTFDDVQISNLDDPIVTEALTKGAIDVTATSEPWLTRIVESGSGVVWRPAQEILPNFQAGILIFGPTLVKTNRDAGLRYMRAYLKGVEQYHQGKTARNIEILAKYTKLDPELLKKSCWPSIHADGQVNAASILDYQTWAMKNKLLDKAAAANQIWDPSFAQQAAHDLGIRP